MVVKFLHKRFDVEITREVGRESLHWPFADDLRSDAYEGNMGYYDLRGRTWTEAHESLALEKELVERVENAADPKIEIGEIEDELYEEFDNELWGLDLGVVSTVIALSAAKSIPFASCNGGAFGDRHYEDHPLVVFHAKSRSVDLLLKCAERANTGLENQNGGLMAYANCITDMMAFAGAIIASSDEFDALHKL